VAGAVSVVVAGWTTANPTLYRAGLALQSATPNWQRWKVTLGAGIVTTIAALFPALMMKLLDFVALYGLILMPMGAVIFADFWLAPRIGLQSRFAELRGISISWPALAAWGVSLAVCLMLPLELYFKALPGWFIAVTIFLGLSLIQQRAAAILGLTLTIVPAVLVAAQTLSRETHVHLMAAGMVLWFLSAPFVMRKK
jgi:purine-cytosine permease-like protein